ncbi:CHASE domain-containing protein [Stutzerimonas tarimensis]|uniref:histidine kinase n=1 Tax=Stutzerimonas tarimensis TaxID=1507735 RepID=A0ABV7T1F2_9GAMM
MEDRPTLKTRRPWLPVLVTLALLAGLGGWVGWQWSTLENRALFEHERRFNFEVDYIEHRLRERMQAYEMVLRGLAGLMTASEEISPETWLKATDQLRLQEIYPGIQALNLARFAPHEQLAPLERQLDTGSTDGGRIWPPSDREEHVVVQYTYPPVWSNRKVIGFNLLSEGVRREAILRARNTGYPTLSGPLRLIQETDDSAQAATLLFLPVYAPTMPQSNLAERQAAFIGALYGAFRLDDLMEGVLTERYDLFDIQLFDAAEPALPLLAAQAQRVDAEFRQERPIYVYGRNWRLVVASTPRYEASIGDDNRAFSLIAGLTAVLLFSLLVGGYLYLRERTLASSRALTLQLREREARFRVLIEKLPVATLLCDEGGRIELANQSAATLLDQDVERLLGSRVSYYLPGVLSTSQQLPEDPEILAYREDGEPVPVTLHSTRFSHFDQAHYVLNLVDLRAFKRAEERFRDMVEGLPNAFVLTGHDGRIVMINRQTEMLLGYSREELLGQPVESLLPDELRDDHVRIREAYLRQPEAIRIGNNREVFGQHRDGSRIPLEIGLAPLRSGEEVLVQAVLIDVSHRKAAELRLRDQADQLAIASRYKSEFLANMSHELRTPLNSILLLSDQMRQNATGTLTDKQVQYADIMHRAGNELLQLINDVLDLSRIDAGRLPLAPESVDIPALLQELEDHAHAQAAQKRLRFATQITPGTPQALVTDRARLQQILGNLLSNALKFTERGSVELIVCHCEAAGQEWLQFQVHDTGIGIPEDQQERIFQAFQQIDGSISRHHGGTGLGLAITRQLVEVLGGHISLRSALGQGACFTVELPLVRHLPGEPGLDEGNESLLLLEADSEAAEQVLSVAHSQGLGVLRCRDEAQAVAALSERRFMAVIVDLDSAYFDGWAFYRRLRENPAYHQVPVVLLASAAQSKGWQDGALHYLTKPLSKLDLQRLLVDVSRRESNSSRLLLIEAEPERGKRLRARFERLGYSVTLVTRSDDARLAFAAHGYRALVMDFDLPQGGGQDLLDALNRLRPFNKETKVIVYSREPLSQAGLQRLQNQGAVAMSRSDSEDRMDALLSQQPPARPGATRDVSEQPLLGRRVLVFEPDVRSVFVLSGQLDELGLQATAATTLDEAIERFESEAYDLVLMSVQADGAAPELVRQLRSEHGCQVPILCLAEEPERDGSLVEGTNDVIAKPVQTDALEAVVQRWLGKGGETSV